MPVIPATREAEAGESLEPGRQRLQRTEVAPLHSSLGNRVRLHLKTNKKRNNFRELHMEAKAKKLLDWLQLGICLAWV